MQETTFFDEHRKELYILSQRSYVFTIYWAVCVYDGRELGIEELYDQLPRPKPSISTFRSVLQQLERSGLIRINVSLVKKVKRLSASQINLKKIVAISEECFNSTCNLVFRNDCI